MCGERMLAAITMCTPYWYHRIGKTRVGQGVRAELPPRELALGETNTASRAWECTYRITSRREQLRGDSFAFLALRPKVEVADLILESL